MPPRIPKTESEALLPPLVPGYLAIDPSMGVVLGSPEALAIMAEPQLGPAELARQAQIQRVREAVATAALVQEQAVEDMRAHSAAKRGPEPEEIWVERRAEDGSGSDVYVVPERGYTSVNGKVVPGIDTRVYRPDEAPSTPEPLPELVDVIEVEPRGTGLWGLVRNVQERRLRGAQRTYNHTLVETAAEREAAAAIVERRGFRPEVRPITARQQQRTRQSIAAVIKEREALLEREALGLSVGKWNGADASTGTAYITEYARTPDGEYETTPDGKRIEVFVRDRQGRKIVVSDIGTARQAERIQAGRYTKKEVKLEDQAARIHHDTTHEIDKARKEVHHLAYHNRYESRTPEAQQRLDSMAQKVQDARRNEAEAESKRAAKKAAKVAKRAGPPPRA